MDIAWAGGSDLSLHKNLDTLAAPIQIQEISMNHVIQELYLSKIQKSNSFENNSNLDDRVTKTKQADQNKNFKEILIKALTTAISITCPLMLAGCFTLMTDLNNSRYGIHDSLVPGIIVDVVIFIVVIVYGVSLNNTSDGNPYKNGGMDEYERYEREIRPELFGYEDKDTEQLLQQAEKSSEQPKEIAQQDCPIKNLKMDIDLDISLQLIGRAI